jgi:hypothetical protein
MGTEDAMTDESRQEGGEGSGRRHAGDYMDPARFTVDELRRAVFEGEPGSEGEGAVLSRLTALHMLGHKEYPEKVADLTRVLLEEREASRLRQSAAVLLGRTGTEGAVQALERAAAVTDGRALRGVLEGLALAGRRASLEVLAPLARRRGSVGQAVARTTRLLRHRAGAAGEGLRTSSATRLLKVRPRQSVGIEVGPARGRRVETAVAGVAARHPALRLTTRSAVGLTCQGRELLVLFDGSILDEGVTTLSARKAQPAVVAEHTTLEGDAWEPKFHVLTEPSRGNTLRITVASARGEIRLTGTGRREGEGIRFSLASLELPGAVAVELEGEFREGRLTFSRAVSESVRRQAAEPTPLDG